MKKIILIIFSVSFLFCIPSIFCLDNISAVKFIGKRVMESQILNKSLTSSQDFFVNMAYHPFLPEGAIYMIKNPENAKTALIEIVHGFAENDAKNIYLSNSLFNFLKNPATDQNSIPLSLEFISLNNIHKKSAATDVSGYILSESKSKELIQTSKPSSYFVQIGAFAHFENAQTVVKNILPFLDITPQFLTVLAIVNGKRLYRILMGPYETQEANAIKTEINTILKRNITFLHQTARLRNSIQ